MDTDVPMDRFVDTQINFAQHLFYYVVKMYVCNVCVCGAYLFYVIPYTFCLIVLYYNLYLVILTSCVHSNSPFCTYIHLIWDQNVRWNLTASNCKLIFCATQAATRSLTSSSSITFSSWSSDTGGAPARARSALSNFSQAVSVASKS